MVLIPRRYLHLVFQPVLPALLVLQDRQDQRVHPVVMVQMVQPAPQDRQDLPEPQPDLTLLLPLLVLLA